jgi:hypothetical protein
MPGEKTAPPVAQQPAGDNVMTDTIQQEDVALNDPSFAENLKMDNVTLSDQSSASQVEEHLSKELRSAAPDLVTSALEPPTELALEETILSGSIEDTAADTTLLPDSCLLPDASSCFFSGSGEQLPDLSNEEFFNAVEGRLCSV